MATAVSVDDDFARFGAKSYSINKINSVDVRERHPHGKTGAMICGAISILIILSMLGSRDFSAGPFITAGLFGGVAYWQWQRAKIKEYLLFLMTSSSETQAFVTRDFDEVQSLRAKIEKAMTRHSQGGIRA